MSGMSEDFIQRAEALVLQEVETGVQAIRARLPVKPLDFDGLCTECEAPIPQKRVDFGAITCIGCQTAIEARGSRYRR